MQINTDLSTDTSSASLQRSRAETGASASQSASSAASTPAASLLDPSLQRLADVPVGTQDAEWEIQDEQTAAAAVESLRQGMSQQPGMAMSAQANQLYQNVLNLLQPAD
jgi:flagellin-like hook-associated protein FlgL